MHIYAHINTYIYIHPFTHSFKTQIWLFPSNARILKLLGVDGIICFKFIVTSIASNAKKSDIHTSYIPYIQIDRDMFMHSLIHFKPKN